MSEIINVSGLADLQRFLDQLPAKMEANILRGALRAGAKPMLEATKQACPTGEPNNRNKSRYKGYKGALRDSLRISGRIDKRSGNIIAKIVAGGKNKKTGADVFYAQMVEFGTKPHSILKGGKGQPNHPGMSPRAFMRPALDSQAQASILAAGEYIKKRLATREGINTSDIEIGIDE